MKNPVNFLTAAVLGGLTALPVIALAYLGQQLLGLPFLPFDVFDWLARTLPGPLVTWGIDSLVAVINAFQLGPTDETAKLAEQGFAIVLFIVAGAAFGLILAAAGWRRPGSLVGFGLVGGLILLVVMLLIEFSLGLAANAAPRTTLWLAALFLTWGYVLARLIRDLPVAAEESSPAAASRRQFLYVVGAGSLAAVLAALGILLREEPEETAETPDLDDIGAASTDGPAESPPQRVLEARIEPAPGTRPELTSTDNFYRIDINTLAPNVDGDTWRLELAGLVERPLTLTLAEVRARPSFSQVITLECISNTLGGDLISTALWTGVRMKDLLEEAGLLPGAQEVYIESVDGFYESVPLEEAQDERTLLVYEMNGQPLPDEHGFPLRIYIPNHYGMKQPKWIERMEVIDERGPGYWVERGWSETAIPYTTAVIDVAAVDARQADGTVPVGGIAYAGARGISQVEVQVDEGPWEAAELRSPPLSPLTWVQWRYAWQAEPGRHILRVRAYDGTGELQVLEHQGPHPNGATGVHSLTVRLPGAAS